MCINVYHKRMHASTHATKYRQAMHVMALHTGHTLQLNYEMFSSTYVWIWQPLLVFLVPVANSHGNHLTIISCGRPVTMEDMDYGKDDNIITTKQKIINFCTFLGGFTVNNQSSLSLIQIKIKKTWISIHIHDFLCHDDVIKWKHFPRNWPFVRGIHRSRWITHTKASDAELWCFLWSASG